MQKEKKDTERSRSSIEESTGGDKETSGQRKEVDEWKVGDRVMLSTKDLVFKERSTKKLVDQYIALYTIEEVISTNAVKL